MDQSLRAERWCGMNNCGITIGTMKWKNPVTVASGTFGLEFAELMNPSSLGAIVTKTVTKLPKSGNPPCRLAETEAGLLNSIGIQNPGIHDFIESVLPSYRIFNTNLIVSISGNSIDEFVELISILNHQSGIHAYEINVSCPNVENEGIAFGTDATIVKQLVSAIRPVTIRPFIVKLTPNVTSIETIAVAAESGGADGISLINTVYGMAIDIEQRCSKIKKGIAGYSGIGIKPIALQAVYRVSNAVSIPVIGMGGIRNTRDALEFIIAGASAIAVGTQNFVNPQVSLEIIQGIESYIKEQHISYSSLIGSLQM